MDGDNATSAQRACSFGPATHGVLVEDDRPSAAMLVLRTAYAKF